MKHLSLIFLTTVLAAFFMMSCDKECSSEQNEADAVTDSTSVIPGQDKVIPILSIGFDQLTVNAVVGSVATLNVTFTPANTTDTDFFLEYDPSMLELGRDSTSVTLLALSPGTTAVTVRSAANAALQGDCEIIIANNL